MNSLRIEYIEKLGGKCVICESTERLQFDHKDKSTKKYRISNIWKRKIEIIDKEINKCQLLCIVCHAKKTAKDNGKNVYEESHGNPSWYINKKCLCSICYEAKKEYQRSYMRKRRLLVK